MYIKVKFPFADKSTHSHFEVGDDEFRLGDIVRVDINDVDFKYGVVNNVGVKGNPYVSSLVINKVNDLDRVYFWLDFESNLLKNKVILNNNALTSYRKVKGNSKLTNEQLVNKMTRNLLLVAHTNRIEISKSGNLVFRYGALRITYGYNEVFSIINKSESKLRWYKDMDKYNYYSKILGVDKL